MWCHDTFILCMQLRCEPGGEFPCPSWERCVSPAAVCKTDPSAQSPPVSPAAPASSSSPVRDKDAKHGHIHAAIQMLCKRHHDVWPCIRVINHAQPTWKHFTIFIQWLKIFSTDLAGRLVWFLPEEGKLFAVWFRDGRPVNVLLIIIWWLDSYTF